MQLPLAGRKLCTPVMQNQFWFCRWVRSGSSAPGTGRSSLCSSCLSLQQVKVEWHGHISDQDYTDWQIGLGFTAYGFRVQGQEVPFHHFYMDDGPCTRICRSTVTSVRDSVLNLLPNLKLKGLLNPKALNPNPAEALNPKPEGLNL